MKCSLKSVKSVRAETQGTVQVVQDGRRVLTQNAVVRLLCERCLQDIHRCLPAAIFCSLRRPLCFIKILKHSGHVLALTSLYSMRINSQSGTVWEHRQGRLLQRHSSMLMWRHKNLHVYGNLSMMKLFWPTSHNEGNECRCLSPPKSTRLEGGHQSLQLP